MWVGLIQSTEGLKRKAVPSEEERIIIQPAFRLKNLTSNSAWNFRLFAHCTRFWLSLFFFSQSLQSYTYLCNSRDCSLPVSSGHRILQARILEWAAISFSRESSWPRNGTCISCTSCIADFLPTEPPGICMCQFLIINIIFLCINIELIQLLFKPLTNIATKKCKNY